MPIIGVGVSPVIKSCGGGAGMSPQYQTVYNAFGTPPSSSDAAIQATMLDALVSGGYYAKAELLDVLSCHNKPDSLFNWRNPALFKVTENTTVAWTQYAGFKGDGGSNYLQANFVPAIDGTIIGQDNMCMVWGIGSDASENLYDIHCGTGGSASFSARSRASNLFRMYCNNTTLSSGGANANAIKHYAISRGNSANFDVYQNTSKTNIAAASTGLANFPLNLIISSQEMRYFFLFSYLTEAEVTAVMAIMEAYLDNYGTGLI
jgi:hypothetical protein